MEAEYPTHYTHVDTHYVYTHVYTHVYAHVYTHVYHMQFYTYASRLAMFYSAEMPHEVLPSSAERHALTVWYGALHGTGHCVVRDYVVRGTAWCGALRGAGHCVVRGTAWCGALRGAGHCVSPLLAKAKATP